MDQPHQRRSQNQRQVPQQGRVRKFHRQFRPLLHQPVQHCAAGQNRRNLTNELKRAVPAAGRHRRRKAVHEKERISPEQPGQDLNRPELSIRKCEVSQGESFGSVRQEK